MSEEINKKVNAFLFWSPRILAILFIIFLSLFSLDILELKLGFWETIVGLIMHNFPVFFLIIILIISWKHELVGGIIFTLAGILYIARILFSILTTPPYQLHMLFWTLPISGPAFLVGILFLINWSLKKK